MIAVALLLARNGISDRHRQAARERLARGESARFADREVRCVHELVHAVGEAEHCALHARFAAARDDVAGAAAERFVLAAHERDAAVDRHRKHLLQRFLKQRRSDAAAGNEQHRPAAREAEALAQLRARWHARRESARDRNARHDHAFARHALTRKDLNSLRQRDEPAVRARTRRPHRVRIEVGHDDREGACPFAALDHARDQLRREKMRAHDRVGLIACNHAPQTRQRGALHRATHRAALDRVARSVQPADRGGRGFDQLDVGIAVDRAKRRTCVGERVDDQRPLRRVCAKHRLTHSLRGARVSRPDRSGEQQHAPERRRLFFDVRRAFMHQAHRAAATMGCEFSARQDRIQPRAIAFSISATVLAIAAVMFTPPAFLVTRMSSSMRTPKFSLGR